MGLDTSYFPFEIRNCWSVVREDKGDSPIHNEYLRSGGAKRVNSLVVGCPPCNTMGRRDGKATRTLSTKVFWIHRNFPSRSTSTVDREDLEATNLIGVVDGANVVNAVATNLPTPGTWWRSSTIMTHA